MVVKKLYEIMEELEYVQKDSKIQTNRGAFTVLSEAKMLSVFRPFMMKKKLVLVPREVRDLVRSEPNERGTAITTAIFKFAFIDIEDGDTLELEAPGQGADSGDKAAGMAYTYAYKNVIKKALMLVAGDDPDTVQEPASIPADVQLLLDKARALHNDEKLSTKELEWFESNISAVIADPEKKKKAADFLANKES